MTERTPMGYCEDCPMAAWLNLQAEAYIADAPLSGIDDNTVEILSIPDDLTRAGVDLVMVTLRSTATIEIAHDERKSPTPPIA